MDIILVPGLWLDGSSWDEVVVDARPDRVARVVYVDSWPTDEGRLS